MLCRDVNTCKDVALLSVSVCVQLHNTGLTGNIQRYHEIHSTYFASMHGSHRCLKQCGSTEAAILDSFWILNPNILLFTWANLNWSIFKIFTIYPENLQNEVMDALTYLFPLCMCWWCHKEARSQSCWRLWCIADNVCHTTDCATYESWLLLQSAFLPSHRGLSCSWWHTLSGHMCVREALCHAGKVKVKLSL
jgi:hypothetical protein